MTIPMATRNPAVLVEYIYNNAGQRRHMIVSERAGYIRNIRRLMSEMEFELMEDAPNDARIIALAEETKSLCNSLQELSK